MSTTCPSTPGTTAPSTRRPASWLADVLLPVFVDAWGSQGLLLPLLRAAATNRTAADALLAVFVGQVPPALATVTPDRAPERASLVGSQLLGLAVARYIIGVPPLTAMSDAQLIEWLRPVLAHYLTDPAPRRCSTIVSARLAHRRFSSS